MKLEIGYNHPYEIRKVGLAANCDAQFSICYISDLHFNRYSGPVCRKLSEDINRLDPDIILLGGDYADSKKGLAHLDDLLKQIAPNKKLFAIAGNHDEFFGIEKIKAVMKANGVGWIEQRSVYVALGRTMVRIDGNRSFEQEAAADFSILCLHKPLPAENIRDRYHLAVAGHLHGGQFVFWQNDNGLYPAKFFYPCNFIERRRPGGVYLVSKGLGDTLPVRYNCKQDLLFVQVNLKTEL
jgi:predicted MPP superfamily phosphohydrolase